MSAERPRGSAAWLMVVLLLPAGFIVWYAYRAFFAGPATVAEAGMEAKSAVVTLVSSLSGDSPEAFLDLAPRGTPVLGWAGTIVDVASKAQLLAQPQAGLAGMAVTREGLVVAVSGGRLSYLHEGGLSGALAVPGGQARVERVGERLCVYGPLPAAGAPVMAGGKPIAAERHWGVFLLDRAGRYAKLFTFPSEISALSETDDGLVFAAGGSIYRVVFGRRLEPVLYLPAQPRVTALAWEPGRGRLAFSTERALYLLDSGRVAKLLEGPGVLRWGRGGLYVLARARRELLKVEGL